MKYCSGSQIKEFEVGGACGMYWGKEKCVLDLAGKPEGNRRVGIPRLRREDNIKMELD